MKENQRVRLSKKMLRESLIKLLYEKDIQKISIREICDNAEINRTTFYKYYGSQFDLLKDIEDQFLKEIDDYMGLRDSENSKESERLKKSLIFINENSDTFRILCNNNVDKNFPERLFNLPEIRRIFEQQIGSKYTKSEADYLFAFIVTGGLSIVREWVNNDQREPAEEISIFIRKTINKLFV